MSNLGIRTDASGTFGALTLGGVDKVTVGNQGIQAGSYAPDSITATELAPGALIETSPLNGIGYGPGAGGTVTQSTSKGTAVTLNKPCGKITMNAASLAASARVSFQFNNNLIGLNDVLVASTCDTGGINPDLYDLQIRIAPGAAVINVINRSGVALAEALGINFALIKGAIS